MFYLRSAVILLWVVACSFLSFLGVIWERTSMNHLYGRFFTYVVQWVSGIRVETEGMEHADAHRPCIYVANHQSGMDVMVFGPMYPRRTVLIGKKQLLWIPFFGLFYVAGGNILIDRQKRVKALAGLDQAVERMKRDGSSIWIFPEGTRNTQQDTLLPFKKGAFYMAIQAGVPVVPVVAGSMSPLFNAKKGIMRRGTVRVRVLPPISTQGMTDRDVDSLLKMTRERMIQAFKELSAS